MFNEHYYCKTEEDATEVVNTQSVTNVVAEPATASVSTATEETTTEDDIDELLKDL